MKLLRGKGRCGSGAHDDRVHLLRYRKRSRPPSYHRGPWLVLELPLDLYSCIPNKYKGIDKHSNYTNTRSNNSVVNCRSIELPTLQTVLFGVTHCHHHFECKPNSIVNFNSNLKEITFWIPCTSVLQIIPICELNINYKNDMNLVMSPLLTSGMNFWSSLNWRLMKADRSISFTPNEKYLAASFWKPRKRTASNMSDKSISRHLSVNTTTRQLQLLEYLKGLFFSSFFFLHFSTTTIFQVVFFLWSFLWFPFSWLLKSISQDLHAKVNTSIRLKYTQDSMRFLWGFFLLLEILGNFYWYLDNYCFRYKENTLLLFFLELLKDIFNILWMLNSLKFCWDYGWFSLDFKQI